MEEQTHTGIGDNVHGDKTEIERQAIQGANSTYNEGSYFVTVNQFIELSKESKNYLLFLIVTSYKSEIDAIEELRGISERYGENLENWRPFHDNLGIFQIMEEYIQTSCLKDVKYTIINRHQFEGPQSYQIFKDEDAKKIILITDGISIFKDDISDILEAFNQEKTGGFLVPICERSTPPEIREYILEKFRRNIRDVYNRFSTVFYKSHLNVEIGVQSKSLLFRRITNIVFHHLNYQPTIIVATLERFKTKVLQNQNPDGSIKN